MKITLLHHSILTGVLGMAAMLAPAWAASGRIAAHPNPCEIAPGAHDCTTYLTWTTEGVQHARVFVRGEGKAGTPEREFGNGRACEKCSASWIAEGDRYIFTLVDFSNGRRGEVLATVTVTAVRGPGGRAERGTGGIQANPNPCRIPPGKVDCTTELQWFTVGVEHARVYVTAEGRKASPEKEFGTGRACERCEASWIAEGTRYLFTLYDFSSGSRGRALASVVVTAIK